jgi:hypothetical protein
MLLFELKASNARELTEDKINKKSADAYHSLRRALNKKIIKATKQGKFECEIMVPDAVVSSHRERLINELKNDGYQVHYYSGTQYLDVNWRYAKDE